MRILLAEDDPMIGAAVERGLRQEGFVVDWVRDGAQAQSALSTQLHDVLLLDIGLPRKDGLDVLASMRRRNDARPVLVITARDAVSVRVAGLDAGADDYLVKPFDLDELAARIRALGRRRSGRVAPSMSHGDIALDPASKTVMRSGTPVSLSPREFALLEALMTRPAAVLSRAQLEERLYGWDEPVESNAVEVHLHALRRKLGADTIRNIRGVGWSMAPARPPAS